jgi:hypothetical protein
LLLHPEIDKDRGCGTTVHGSVNMPVSIMMLPLSSSNVTGRRIAIVVVDQYPEAPRSSSREDYAYSAEEQVAGIQRF